MSESMITEQLDRDDRAALTALAQVMAGGTGVAVPRSAPAADEALVREYLETLGLIPYGLESEAPSVAVKESLMAQIGGRASVGSSDRGFDEVTFAGVSADPFDVTLHGRESPPPAAPTALEAASAVTAGPRELGSGEPRWPEPVAAEAAGAIPFPIERQAAAAQPPRRSRWTGLLAAALVLCLAGLGYLIDKVERQSATIAQLSTELEGIPVADLSSFRDELDTVKRRFHMVTAVAREVYHLQGVEEISEQPIDGVVYVCGNHQRWYLNVQGLEAPPEGREYRLWFVTGDGMVNGGEVRVEKGARAEMEAQSMPGGTTGFAITLEEIGNDRDPGGIMVLLGEESVSL